jgi:hypothetical protein
MARPAQDIHPTLLRETGQRAGCLPASRPQHRRAARPPRPRAHGRIVAVVAAVLAAAAAAATATASPSASAGGLRDTQIAGAQQTPRGEWGGAYTTPTGETVEVFASNTYPQDPAIPQRWANFLSTLVHGPEIATITAHIAPLNEVQRTCGERALACYSPNARALYAPGEAAAFDDPSAEAIVMHEYGHHVAASRTNAPWQAVDWGTKRWASYTQVCRRTRDGQLFPGAETSADYVRNPGEGFAEAYRVLNERKLGVPETPWDVVSRALYPDDRALQLLEQDVVQPWRGNTAESRSGSFARSGRATRSYTVATPLDGTFRVSLRAPRGSRLALDLYSGATRIGHAAASTPTSTARSISLTVCGQRSIGIRVTRNAGAGAFALAISKP